jgi:hypothetical protein
MSDYRQGGSLQGLGGLQGLVGAMRNPTMSRGGPPGAGQGIDPSLFPGWATQGYGAPNALPMGRVDPMSGAPTAAPPTTFGNGVYGQAPAAPPPNMSGYAFGVNPGMGGAAEDGYIAAGSNGPIRRPRGTPDGPGGLSDAPAPGGGLSSGGSRPTPGTYGAGAGAGYGVAGTGDDTAFGPAAGTGPRILSQGQGAYTNGLYGDPAPPSGGGGGLTPGTGPGGGGSSAGGSRPTPGNYGAGAGAGYGGGATTPDTAFGPPASGGPRILSQGQGGLTGAAPGGGYAGLGGGNGGLQGLLRRKGADLGLANRAIAGRTGGRTIA